MGKIPTKWTLFLIGHILWLKSLLAQKKQKFIYHWIQKNRIFSICCWYSRNSLGIMSKLWLTLQWRYISPKWCKKWFLTQEKLPKIHIFFIIFVRPSNLLQISPGFEKIVRFNQNPVAKKGHKFNTFDQYCYKI